MFQTNLRGVEAASQVIRSAGCVGFRRTFVGLKLGFRIDGCGPEAVFQTNLRGVEAQYDPELSDLQDAFQTNLRGVEASEIMRLNSPISVFQTNLRGVEATRGTAKATGLRGFRRTFVGLKRALV